MLCFQISIFVYYGVILSAPSRNVEVKVLLLKFLLLATYWVPDLHELD